MSISAVILNYNDSEGTIASVERIKDFSIFNFIVVVDNCSSDESVRDISAYLKMLNESASCSENPRSENPRFILIENDKNGGYGYGNNCGINYSREILGCTHAVVANPDSIFCETDISAMLDVFCQEEKTAVVGAVMREKDSGISYEEFISSAWPLRSAVKYIAYAGPVLKRLFKNSLNYGRAYFETARKTTAKGNTYIEAEAVHGSLLMVDTEKFAKCGGYDEQVFLYCEEDILAQRIKRQGFRSFCILDKGYYHEGSHTISKNGNNAIKRQRFRQESERYYMEKYLEAGAFRKMLFSFIQKIVLIETWLMAKMGILG
ncbi:MAG: glycosyltransferase [Eubacteriales bacterium]|nr:glycosyltransferase [Eubacteriales bacterium]